MGVRVPPPAPNEYRTEEQGMLNEEVCQRILKSLSLFINPCLPVVQAGSIFIIQTINMATVTKENIGLLHEKLTVKLEKTDYLPAFEKALKEYSKKANIPGFRLSHLPGYCRFHHKE